MKKVIIYTRVSTTEQANKGFSLAKQKEDCITFAKKQGFEVVKIFEERGESAKTTDRKELQSLLKYCTENRKQINALIVWKFDRLSRNVEDHYSLMAIFNKFSIEILSATENNDNTATGKLTRNMLQAFSQFENDQKSERVIAGMKQALSEGKWLWKAPYGYKYINGTLVPDENTAPVVKRIYTLFASGLYTQTQIIKLLEKENIFIKTGMMFKIIRNPVYCGNIYCKSLSENVVKGAFEPIISEELFNKVQMLLNGGEKIVTSYIKNNPEYPLKQFILCPCCGSPLTASKSTGRKNKKYAYYHCYNPECKTQVRIPKDKLENMFIEFLDDIKPKYDNLSNFKSIVKKTYNESVKDTKNILIKLNKDLAELQKKKDKLFDFYINDKINQDDYNEQSCKLNEKIQKIKENILSNTLPNDDFEQCFEFVCDALENIQKIWLASDIDTKQRLQQLIFPDGLIYDENGFRTASNGIFCTKKGGLLPPDFKMVPPSEFESLSTP